MIQSESTLGVIDSLGMSGIFMYEFILMEERFRTPEFLKITTVVEKIPQNKQIFVPILKGTST